MNFLSLEPWSYTWQATFSAARLAEGLTLIQTIGASEDGAAVRSQSSAAITIQGELHG